ncbi:non-hydrolyzing UDP-N-acetylglucosamine 2-epimerase [Acetonema longum]|uniref:UDP-N-acetylglucosamine 2-epimerase (non-hydrolyzing) n=1 Tax=Acetonema longum DSM 6540 TaxID=1009370 RepID=F7NIT2_9FIRM|nr:UDP-N-acetylglucosamine 2-epimerase (non-hydrolyzing) [Acetonema longum]EGO64055.1 UDP-N-acetylglucosamine 2-epimerase [Acetonema longum DSM 6540]
MAKLKVMTIFGTRPEAIKMAPVVLELAKYPEWIQPIVAVTAQHREMLDQVLRLFQIRPNYDLDIMCQGQTLFDITCRSLNGLNAVLASEKPSIVLVHGDTTTTFVAALAAFYHQIPVGHVEAGLRTGNKYSPYPEEMNRKLTGSLTDMHFAPTATAKANLLAEAVNPDTIYVTGNTVIDALKATVDPRYTFCDPLARIPFAAKRIILVTTHRRENLGEPMRHVYRALARITAEFSDVEMVFPVHRNPRVREVVQAELGNNPRVHLIDPLEYQPFANAIARSYLILTDSGGIQEEAPALGKPVLVLRDTTERPEALAAGTVKLVGTSCETVYRETARLLSDPAYYRMMAEACNPYGDGLTASRIVKAILFRYGLIDTQPAPFACQTN